MEILNQRSETMNLIELAKYAKNLTINLDGARQMKQEVLDKIIKRMREFGNSINLLQEYHDILCEQLDEM